MISPKQAHNLCQKRLIDSTLFLNGEDISTKADSHICRCYSTTNNQDIHRERERENGAEGGREVSKSENDATSL